MNPDLGQEKLEGKGKPNRQRNRRYPAAGH